jgi:hypothetical protein
MLVPPSPILTGDDQRRQIVAIFILDAPFADHPRARYLVGTRREGSRVIDALMDRLLDANDCPTLGHSLDDLIAVLRARSAERV